MQEGTIDFLCGLSKSIIQGLSETPRRGIGDDIVEGIEKSRKKLFTIGVSISIAGTGFFLTLWGIASVIDAVFAMQGFGFVLIGILAVLIGALVYKK